MGVAGAHVGVHIQVTRCPAPPPPGPAAGPRPAPPSAPPPPPPGPQRGIAGGVKYIWPVTQPISDGDLQRKRMRGIREGLGWQLVGCELIECYQ